MLHRQLLAAATILLLASQFHPVDAQEPSSRYTRSLLSGPAVATSGLIITRLSEKDRARWKAVEQLVFSEDINGQPLHPTLRNLWEWIETSGHAVFIEIVRSTRSSTCTAGSFIIERFDPRGERHTAVIRLNLSNIDLAYVGPGAARGNGFIPFEGLNKEERYAEVLGHELAHAVHILTNLDRTRMVEDMVEKTNELLLTYRPRRNIGLLSVEMKRKISQRDALLRELEKYAEAMEYRVWREIYANKAYREKMLSSVRRPLRGQEEKRQPQNYVDRQQ
jgi:hypothetical protein